MTVDNLWTNMWITCDLLVDRCGLFSHRGLDVDKRKFNPHPIHARHLTLRQGTRRLSTYPPPLLLLLIYVCSSLNLRNLSLTLHKNTTSGFDTSRSNFNPADRNKLNPVARRNLNSATRSNLNSAGRGNLNSAG